MCQHVLATLNKCHVTWQKGKQAVTKHCKTFTFTPMFFPGKSMFW